MLEIEKRLAKLIDLKSIVTLLMTVGFIFLSVTKVIPENEFTEIFKLIIIFYFGTQIGKKQVESEVK